jgi:arsenate reductase-like glutaredoxin family protein
VKADGAREIARRARRLYVKAGRETVRFDAARAPFTEADVLPHLVHEDGLLRVPVLIVDDLVVRGYTESLYREAFGG